MKTASKTTSNTPSNADRKLAYYELGAPVGQGPFTIVTLDFLAGNNVCTIRRPRRSRPEMVEMDRCRLLDEQGKPTATMVTWRHPAFLAPLSK